MEGNNEMNNQQNNGQVNTPAAGQQGGQFSNNNYQDYTANIPYQTPVERNEKETGTNGLQIAGLVCGIAAILTCCCYGVPAIILGIVGLVCAITGNKRSKSGVGVAGLVCSIIGLIAGIGMAIYYIWVIAYMQESGLWDQMINDAMRGM